MINNDLQSQNQSDRVKTGIDLYKKGKIKKIMLTGDDGSKKANEIDAMKLQAILSGIPQYDILYDPHGYRTYLSCKRAAEVYKLKKAIVISQDFHLPRIIFLCKKAGIETIGFSADYQGYEFSIYDFTRESLARVKAVIEVFSNKLFSNKK
jgi:SanA protein